MEAFRALMIMGKVIYFMNALIFSCVVTSSPTPGRTGGARQILSSLTKRTIAGNIVGGRNNVDEETYCIRVWL